MRRLLGKEVDLTEMTGPDMQVLEGGCGVFRDTSVGPSQIARPATDDGCRLV